MKRMNKAFEARWKQSKLDNRLTMIELQPRLATLVNAPLIRTGGALVLQPLFSDATSADSFEDRTAYEAFVNKVHVEDFLDERWSDEAKDVTALLEQGSKAAVTLAARLQEYGSYRVLLSLDVDLPTTTMRFFERRGGEPWGADDPDEFQLEEVLIIDT